MAAYQSEDPNMSTTYSSNAYYSRPPGSSHGPSNPDSSPERIHSSHGYTPGGGGGGGGGPAPAGSSSPNQNLYSASAGGGHESGPPPGSSHGYAQSPITPLSNPTYPQPQSSSFYGLSSTSAEAQIPSPPPSSGGRPSQAVVAQYTPDGNPIVPVGISGGKMFQCRGYGECDKVFTRSEHLARHVRKHTGERPFPCHCGKAFSRLDNLRQHAATVHADQGNLNDAMLNSLAPVHAALSQRANRDQRKRGEVVEVPKNAVERPRHNESTRKNHEGEYEQHSDQWDPNERPRTGGYDYPYPPVAPGEGSGPSRRPVSSGYPYQQYYDGRPPTAPGTASSQDSQLPYPYRPMSASGRELPVPSHYAESEPPSSAHGPPQSPLYPGAVPEISSPAHGYHHQQPGMYPPPPPPQGGYYDHSHGYGPPPPGSAGSGYNYAPGYYPYAPPHSSGGYPPPPGSSGGNGGPTASPTFAHPSESSFHYNGGGDYAYDRKRRNEGEDDDNSRKHQRPSSAVPPPRPSTSHDIHGETDTSQADEPLWLPPTTERRSSLAISALLGSPQQNPRGSRPTTADIPESQYHHTFSSAYGEGNGSDANSLPPTPVRGVNGTPRKGKGRGGVKLEPSDAAGDLIGNMEDKAKALLSAGAQH